MDNLEFAEIYLGIQVISAAREKLERSFGREIHGRLLPLHLVWAWCYWLAQWGVGNKVANREGERKDKQKPTNT